MDQVIFNVRYECNSSHTYRVFIFEGLCGSEDKALVFSKNINVLYSFHQPFSWQQEERSLSLSKKTPARYSHVFIVFHSYNLQKKN